MLAGASRIALIAMACIAATAAAAAGETQQWGKTLVATYSLPREAVERFNALKSQAANPKLSALENMLERASESWQSATPLEVSAKANPYRIVIRYDGEVTGDEGAVTLWNAGWFRQGSMQTPEGTISTPLAGLNVSAADGKLGTRVTRVGAGGPLSFRYDGAAYPSIEINRLEGLRLDRVEVEVWSGLASAGWTEMLLGWHGALVGLVMLALWFVFFRRRGRD
jgi:hypothetical protein